MLISLITVTYNSASTLAQTILSVLSQTHQELEYIVVDGHSNDNTVDIIRQYEPEFSGRMKWISEEDDGLYDAMNKGIKMATGDIVGILNSDDFFTDSTVLSVVAKKFEGTDCDAVYANVNFVNFQNTNKIVRYYSSSIFRRSLMRFGLMPAHPTFYTYKSVFEKYGFYKTDYKIAADFECLLRLIYLNKIKTEYIPKTFVTMRLGGVSTSSLKSYKRIMSEHLKTFNEHGLFVNRFMLSLRYFYKLTEYLFVNRKCKKYIL